MCSIVLPDLDDLKDYVPLPRPVPCLDIAFFLCKI